MRLQSSFGAIFTFLCLTLVPLFLADIALVTVLEQRFRHTQEVLSRKLNDVVVQLGRFHNDGYFYHLLLRRAFLRADQSAHPFRVLRRELAGLRQRYPGAMQFVVWDGAGEVYPELSDIQGFRFLLKKTWAVFSEVTQNAAASAPVEIDELPITARDFRLLPPFLGRLLLLPQLDIPLRPGTNAEPIRIEYSPHKSRLWFQIGRQLGLLGFLDDSLYRRQEGLRAVIGEANKRLPADLGVGFRLLPDLEQLYMPGREHVRNTLAQTIQRIEESGQDHLTTDRVSVVSQSLGPRVRVFAYAERTHRLPEVATQVAQWRRSMVLIAVPALLLLILWYCLHQDLWLSIRLELAVLFIAANGLPLLVLGLQVYEYHQYRRTTLEKKALDRLDELIRIIDQRHQDSRELLARRLLLLLEEEKTSKSSGGKPVSDAFISALKQLEPSTCHILDEKGASVWEYHRQRKNTSLGVMVISTMAKIILANLNAGDKLNPDDLCNLEDATRIVTNHGVMEIFPRIRKQVYPLALGNTQRWGMLTELPEKNGPGYRYILLITWEPGYFDQIILDDSLPDIGRAIEPVQLCALIDGNDRTVPANAVPLKEAMEVLTHQSKRAWKKLNWQGQRWIGLGRHGEHFSATAFLGLYPASRIDAELQSLRDKLILLACLNLGIALIIAQGLAGQVLAPIKQLTAAVEAIGQRNFQYRLHGLPNDEFGQLGDTFNQTLEGLAELDLARVVQESFLPEKTVEAGRFHLTGRNKAMLELGGDYFDFQKINDTTWSILLGDVAGHGVQAALIMAMAKATMVTVGAKADDPKVLVDNLHAVLHHLRRSKRRYMMTLLHFMLNVESGILRYCHAGQTFPLIIGPETEQARFIEMAGTPVGPVRRPRFEEGEFHLAPGASIILYTDGMVESANQDGEAFSYERLLQTGASIARASSSSIIDQLFFDLQQWAPEAQDDLTIVVVQHRDNVEHSA